MIDIPDNWSQDLYYNLPIDEMVEVIKSALKNGYSVCWDGDVSDTWILTQEWGCHCPADRC